jgi:hypothetical protein
LLYLIRYSTATPEGWKTPWIPVLLITSLCILVAFCFVERYKERKGLGVILPMSIWLHPDRRMIRYISMVFFCWYDLPSMTIWFTINPVFHRASFNSITYLLNVFWQETHTLSPVQTAIRLAPTAISSTLVSLLVGWLLGFVPPYWITLGGLMGGAVSHQSYFPNVNIN